MEVLLKIFLQQLVFQIVHIDLMIVDADKDRFIEYEDEKNKAIEEKQRIKTVW